MVSDSANGIDPAERTPPAPILELEPPPASAGGRGASAAPGGDETARRTGRPPVRRERAPRRPADRDGYGDGDGFRGSAADPVHMYLKEIGKVKLLDAALEVELAERILAGNEAAERLAACEGPVPVRALPNRRRTGCWCGGDSRPRRP